MWLQLLLWTALFTATLEAATSADPESELLERVIRELSQQKRELTNGYYQRPETALPEATDEGEWVVRVSGGLDRALQIAKETNSQLQRQVRGFDDLYVFERESVSGSRHKRAPEEFSRHLRQLNGVLWAEHQDMKVREKRQSNRNPWFLATFNDPLWPLQWQLHSYNTSKRGDMRIVEAWQLGYTGKDVVVSILDDGLDHRHPDLAPNYEPKASYDLNDNDDDPTPTYNDDNKHGTRCAGEVAMVANNSMCGVGVAFNSRIAGVRMLDGRINDRLEGEALALASDLVDIYSASWGPRDDGKTVEGPGRLAQLGILKGIREGRQGKGAVYVWASGNGGSNRDDCSCDGYTNSIFTFSVASAAEDGSFPWYAESCPSTLTTTYSSGSNPRRMVATTDTQGTCTLQHSGTSASAPIAAGVIALALEANPSLTWRDVQHLAVWTSDPAPLLARNDGWHMNGVGLVMNSKFGFGLMDALSLVSQAKNWTNVPEQNACATSFPSFSRRPINRNFNTVLTFQTDACRGLPNEVNYLEHIQLVLDVDHSRRGNLELWLVSPSGTRTRLLKRRPNDVSQEGFHFWPFMSLHTWGESPRGRWQLQVEDNGSSRSMSNGAINNISLIVYGTREMPSHYRQNRAYPGVDLNILKEQRAASLRSRGLSPRSAPEPEASKQLVASTADFLDRLQVDPGLRERVRRQPDSVESLLAELEATHRERSFRRTRRRLQLHDLGKAVSR